MVCWKNAQPVSHLNNNNKIRMNLKLAGHCLLLSQLCVWLTLQALLCAPRDLTTGREVPGQTDRECHHWGEGDENCDGEIGRWSQEVPVRPGEDKTTEGGTARRWAVGTCPGLWIVAEFLFCTRDRDRVNNHLPAYHWETTQIKRSTRNCINQVHTDILRWKCRDVSVESNNI